MADADEIIELERAPSPPVARVNVDYVELKRWRVPSTSTGEMSPWTGKDLAPLAVDEADFARRPSMAAVLFRKLSIRRKRMANSGFEIKDPGFGIVNLFTLKVIFFDILVALGDVISDYAQGTALILSGKEENAFYGWITIGINWLPGVVAVVHLVSMYRNETSAKNIAIMAVLLLIFSPIMPVVAYMHLLWRRPKNPHLVEEDTPENKRFKKAEYFAMMSHAIAGGVESPIQFCLQVYLILNGHIPKPWDETGTLVIRDWHSNEMTLPTTAAISLAFSTTSILKSVIEFNIIRVHIEGITTGRRLLDFCVMVCDHLPFLTVAAFFRVAAIVVLLTYINNNALIAIGASWFFMLVFGYRCFDLEKIPLWLISFISIFFPVCFTTHEVTEKRREEMILLQYKTFRTHSFISLVTFIPALAATTYLVNFMPSWIYGSNVILDNAGFNVAIGTTITAGVLAYILSLSPNWFAMIKVLVEGCNVNSVRLVMPPSKPSSDEKKSGLDEVDGHRVSAFQVERLSIPELRGKLLRVVGGLVFIVFIAVPAFLPSIVLLAISAPYPYVSITATNETRIIQAVPLNGKLVGPSATFGCLVNQTRLGSNFTMNSKCNDSLVLVVKRSAWSETNKDYSAMSAIIVEDDNPEVHDYRFRPSFPTSNIRIPHSLKEKNVLLVQALDLGWLLNLTSKCKDGLCLIHITTKNETVPKPEFNCSVSTTDCLEVDEFKHRVKGEQHRTISCHWGGKSCFGYSNPSEVQDFCDEPEIYFHMCPRTYRFRAADVMDGLNRTFWARSESFDECWSKGNVATCDDSMKWTNFTRCNPKEKKRSRFCYVKSSECLLIEDERASECQA